MNVDEIKKLIDQGKKYFVDHKLTAPAGAAPALLLGGVVLPVWLTVLGAIGLCVYIVAKADDN